MFRFQELRDPKTYPWFKAAKEGKTSIVQESFHNKEDINGAATDLLYWKDCDENIQALKTLLKLGAIPQSDPLFHVSKFQILSILEVISMNLQRESNKDSSSGYIVDNLINLNFGYFMEKICFSKDHTLKYGQHLNTIERIEAVDKKLTQINKLNKKYKFKWYGYKNANPLYFAIVSNNIVLVKWLLATKMAQDTRYSQYEIIHAELNKYPSFYCETRCKYLAMHGLIERYYELFRDSIVNLYKIKQLRGGHGNMAPRLSESKKQKNKNAAIAILLTS